MLEVIRHALGLCGDGHTNLMWVFGFNPLMINHLSARIKLAYNLMILDAKRFLKHLC